MKWGPSQLYAFCSILGGIVLWQIGYMLLARSYLFEAFAINLFLSSPVGVAQSFVELLGTGELLTHSYASFIAFSYGYLLAAVAGIPLGVLMASIKNLRALIVDPEIFLMDEPFASLDAQTREIMQAELLKMWVQAKKTVIFVTHQIEEAIYLADRVVVFSARPTKVREIVKIQISRPRPLSVKRTKDFLDYTDQIWEIIQEEVLKSMGREVEERGVVR